MIDFTNYMLDRKLHQRLADGRFETIWAETGTIEDTPQTRCTRVRDGSDVALPYTVEIGWGNDIGVVNFLKDEGSGSYDCIRIDGSNDGLNWVATKLVYRFSDDDTAFWFKMKFG